MNAGKTFAFAGILAAVIAISHGDVPILDATSALHAQAIGVPTGEVDLGEVTIPRRVLADGKPLAPGTYRVRLTQQTAAPDAAGELPELNRWAEFLQDGDVKGREIVSIVPKSELAEVAGDRPPASGAAKVEMLKGNEYLRIWINREDTHYLIHLPPA